MKYSEQLRNQQETHARVVEARDKLAGTYDRINGRMANAPYIEDVNAVVRDLDLLAGDIAPEVPEVLAEPGVDGCAAVGRVIMGGIALALTRKSDTGELLLVVENESPTGPTMLRIELMTGASLWRGDVD